MEGSGVGSGGCAVHIGVNGEGVMLWVMQCTCYTEHGRYGSVLYAEGYRVSNTEYRVQLVVVNRLKVRHQSLGIYRII